MEVRQQAGLDGEMTGKSDMSAGCMKYYKKLASLMLIVGGSALLIEHLYNFSGFDIELLGHEYYGIGLIVLGFLLSLKWEQVRGIRRAWKERNLHRLLDEGERRW